MKPATIHFVFENCDWVEIPAVFVKQLHVNSIQGSSVWYSGCNSKEGHYRDWETDRKSTRLNSSHSAKSRMPSSA